MAVQLAALILVPFVAANADEEATTRQMISAETSALPDYTERAPDAPDLREDLRLHSAER